MRRSRLPAHHTQGKLLGKYLQEGPEGSFREVAEGTYIVCLVVGNLATIEVDSSTIDVDSTSLQLEGKLLGNYLQEGAEGSFQEEAK